MLWSNRLFNLLILLTVTIYSSRSEYTKSKDELIDYLFPNQTASVVLSSSSPNSRSLTTTQCVICRGLSYCQILNGYMVQEVYYPKNPSLLGTCYVIEDLGIRLSKEIFGEGRSFRDTAECKEIVMEYLCLWYGTDNTMYTNQCIYQEDVSDSNAANHRVAQRPPCRSFCVQVATVCSNDPHFLTLCEDIVCPPTEDDCTPDPLYNGITLSAELGCDLVYETNPYVRQSGAMRSVVIQSAVSIILILIGVYTLL